MLSFSGCVAVAPAQILMPGQQRDMPVEAAAKNAVVDALAAALKEKYVFPEVAEKVGNSLRERRQKGDYEAITSSMAFARTLTEHLQEVGRDKHLRVRYSTEPLPGDRGPNDPPDAEEMQRQRREMAHRNFGFEKVERLPGNIGLLVLHTFLPPEGAGETAVAAMNFLAGTDALIIDLRQNGGGVPGMVALLSSFLFATQPVHLNSLYWRPTDATHQWWTSAYVPGRRYGPRKPVYVLIGPRTFSAAEEFAYNLKNLKRATLVGETSGGGAHIGGFHRLTEHFAAFIPSGRSISPVTKSNWEGIGVEPDTRVPGPQALRVAYLHAIETLLKTETEEERKRELQAAAARLKRQPEL